MYAAEIRRAVEAAPRVKLPEVAALMWRAYADGHVSEVEAEALAGLIEVRSVLRKLEDSGTGAPNAEIPGIASGRTGSLRSRAGSRPRTDASMARRRRWAASGRLPPALAARFTLAEQAVLAVVSAETVKRGDCRLCHEHVAAAAGVSRSTVKATLRRARALGLVTIEERRLSAWRNRPNVVRVVSLEWSAWLRLARTGNTGRGSGVKSLTRTNTPVSYPVNPEGWTGRKGCRRKEVRGTGKAMPTIRRG